MIYLFRVCLVSLLGFWMVVVFRVWFFFYRFFFYFSCRIVFVLGFGLEDFWRRCRSIRGRFYWTWIYCFFSFGVGRIRSECLGRLCLWYLILGVMSIVCGLGICYVLGLYLLSLVLFWICSFVWVGRCVSGKLVLWSLGGFVELRYLCFVWYYI